MKLEDDPVLYHPDFQMHDVEVRSDMKWSLVSTNLGDNLKKLANTFNIDARVHLPEPTKSCSRIDSMAALSVPKLIFWVVICQTRQIFQAHDETSPSYTGKPAPESPSSWWGCRWPDHKQEYHLILTTPIKDLIGLKPKPPKGRMLSTWESQEQSSNLH